MSEVKIVFKSPFAFSIEIHDKKLLLKQMAESRNDVQKDMYRMVEEIIDKMSFALNN